MDNNLGMNFDNLGDANGQTVMEPVGGKADAKKERHRAEVAKMMAAYQEAITNDPQLQERMGIWSDKVCVEKTLGWTDNGGLVRREDVPDKRKLATIGAIVGYRIRNIGDTPIEYTADVWTQGEDGVYVATPTKKVLQPGDSADLARKDMTIFCSIPEISFVLANGKVMRGSAKGKSVVDELKAYYFAFADKETRVNSDEVKLQVGEKVDGANGQVWRVKPEFTETFGFLNNPAGAKKGRGGKSGKSKDANNMQRLGAAYIRKLLNEQGQL